MSKPLIATRVPGVRDVVEDSRTGLLCEVRSAASLAEAMVRMVALTPEAREEMGRAGRTKVEREFDQALVAAKYLAELG